MKKDLQGYHWCHGNHYDLVNLPSWVAFTMLVTLLSCLSSSALWTYLAAYLTATPSPPDLFPSRLC